MTKFVKIALVAVALIGTAGVATADNYKVDGSVLEQILRDQSLHGN